MTLFRRSGIYHVRFFVNGREKKRSTHCRTVKQAQKVADALQRHLVLGRFEQWERDQSTAYEDMKAALLRDYRLHERRSIRHLRIRFNHLDEYFGASRASQINKDQISQYVDHRLDQKAAKATINRELATLSGMFRVAGIPKPRIPHLRENNARQGFVEWADFKRIRDALPSTLAGLVTVLYVTGWRVSSVANLQWRDIDDGRGTAERIKATEAGCRSSDRRDLGGGNVGGHHVGSQIGSIRVRPEYSKNGQALEFPLNDILREAIYGDDRLSRPSRTKDTQMGQGALPQQPQRVSRNLGQRNSAVHSSAKQILPYVFPSPKTGKPWVNLRKAWKAACKRAGFEGLLMHDLRRSAVRNMVRTNGITEHMAMALAGFKTRMVFDRYDIVSQEDRQMAAEKLGQYLEQSGPGKVRTIKG